MKPVIFCKNINGIFLWAHSSIKCAPYNAVLCKYEKPKRKQWSASLIIMRKDVVYYLLCRLSKQNTIISYNTSRITPNVAESCNQRLPVECFELGKARAIYYACNDLHGKENVHTTSRFQALCGPTPKRTFRMSYGVRKSLGMTPPSSEGEYNGSSTTRGST